MRSSQQRIDCTANSAVSLVIPTLTKPALAVISYTPLKQSRDRRDPRSAPRPPQTSAAPARPASNLPCPIAGESRLRRSCDRPTPVRQKQESTKPESIRRTTGHPTHHRPIAIQLLFEVS